jgi:large subunit ribosomal protein L31e
MSKMAEKTKNTIPELKRTYNIPLRKEYLKVPLYKRAKKAVTAIRQFLMKHMKSQDVRLGQNLNLKVWERGIKHPPHHVQVNVTKDKEGIVHAELVGFDYSEKKPEQVSRKTKNDSVEQKAEEKKETKTESSEQKTVKKGKKALQKELEQVKQN